MRIHSAILVCVLAVAGACDIDAQEPALFSRTKLLKLVNQARKEGRYCGSTWFGPTKSVKWDDLLEQAARIHSEDMFENNFMDHTGSDGKSVDDRLYTVHYFWQACGENVAYGALYEDDVMEEWLGSPGHCANIMNPRYTVMGAWQSGLYWTQVFARPQE